MSAIYISQQDQEYILKALEMGLSAIKEYKGNDRLNYYDRVIREVMESTNELDFLKGLQGILEEIEGELNECVK